MDPRQVAFLATVFATHGLVGYTLVALATDADPRIGFVFGVLPDADFLFPASLGWPFVHRGLTHTPLCWLGVVVATVALRDRTAGTAVGLAYGAHLLLDSLSPQGIAWLYPLGTYWSPGLPIHGVFDTLLIWICCLGMLAWRTDALDPVLARLPGRLERLRTG